jgi:hypothetical protein
MTIHTHGPLDERRREPAVAGDERSFPGSMGSETALALYDGLPTADKKREE